MNQIEQIIIDWHKYRKNTWGFDKIDKNHMCTLQSCKKDSHNIRLIDRQHNIYGCIVSGTVHVCSGRSCNNCVLNSDVSYVCIFSGRVLSQHIQSKMYGEAQDIRFYSSRENNDIDDDKSTYNGLERMMEIPLKEEEEEEEKKQQQLLTKRKPKQNVMPIEIIWPNQDTIQNEKKYKKKKKLEDDLQKSNVKTEKLIYNIINDILCNDNLRVKLAKQTVVNRTKVASDKTIKHFKKVRKKQNILVSIFDIDNFWDQHMSKKKNVDLTKSSQGQICFYVKTCIEFWKLIVTSPYYEQKQSKIHLKDHIIGCLYLMREGYKIQLDNSCGKREITIFEKDPWLDQKLLQHCYLKLTPREKGIHTYQKKNITKGRNNIKQCINSFPDSEKEKKIAQFLNIMKDL